MKNKSGFSSALCCLFFFASLVWCSQYSVAWAQSPSYKVHLITLCEDQDLTVGSFLDVNNVTSLFDNWENMPEPASLFTSEGKSKILDAIKNADVEKDDVLFFYFAGHGVSDKQNNLFLSISPNERFSRKELCNILLEKNARLTIIITDCCAVNFIAKRDDVVAALELKDEYISSNLKKLLSAKGVLNVNSSTPPNEYAIATDYIIGRMPDIEMSMGGLFTNAFLFLISETKQESWSSLMANTKKEMESRYANMKNDLRKIVRSRSANRQTQNCWRKISSQKTQTPYVILLPQGERLIDEQDSSPIDQGSGVRVSRVYPNTTASNLKNAEGERMHVEPNDYLCSINGQQIESDAEFKRIVASLPRNADIEVVIIDHRTSQRMTLYGKMDIGRQLRFGLSLKE